MEVLKKPIALDETLQEVVGQLNDLNNKILIAKGDSFEYEDFTPEQLEALKGAKGDKGDDGFSPIATVTKSGNKSTISITDIDGTTTAEVLDGADGKDAEPYDDTEIRGLIADKVGFTDYATSDKAGVVQGNQNGFMVTASGRPYANNITKSIYDKQSANYFVGKGTLENVLAERLKEKEWKLVLDTTTTEDVNRIVISTFADGSPLLYEEVFAVLEHSSKVVKSHPLTIGCKYYDGSGSLKETTIFGTNNGSSPNARLHIKPLGRGLYESIFSINNNGFNNNPMAQLSIFEDIKPMHIMSIGGYIWDNAGAYGGIISEGTHITIYAR